MTKRRVFVDTNVILEAFRTGTWAIITSHFAVETVDKCVEEALTGDPAEPGRIEVDPNQLRSLLNGRHDVSDIALARFSLSHPNWAGLDDGERHLLAWLKDAGLLGNVHIALSTADRAAVSSAVHLGCSDNLVSLEELILESGVKRSTHGLLRNHFSRAWLSRLKTDLILGSL